MGFLVMDEAFDMWKKRKNRFDYSVDFNEWHEKDLEDMVKRDRNHPSVIIWSIGNEIREQFDSTGKTIARIGANCKSGLIQPDPLLRHLQKISRIRISYTSRMLWIYSALITS
jgi:beta-galactosidase